MVDRVGDPSLKEGTGSAAATLGPGVPAEAAAVTFDRLIAFGDSLTDDGHGLNGYTNGPVWVDYLAVALAIPTVENRAWGGAMTGNGNANELDWSGLDWQVDQFAPPPDLATTLFTVWIGTNDVYGGEADIPASIGNVRRALDGLAAKGARHLLVASLPDITLAPAYRAGTKYAASADRVRELIEEFNRALAAALTDSGDGFAARHPEVELYRVDAHALFDRIAKDGTFKNTTEPWLGADRCPEPAGYMWWDEWHPMTEVHRRVAMAAAAALGPPRNRRSSAACPACLAGS
jgi:phospholipase/lecithinase/hemolysin